MKNRMFMSCYTLAAAVVLANVGFARPALADQEPMMTELARTNKLQQEQLDAQAKTIEAMKGQLDALEAAKKSAGDGRTVDAGPPREVAAVKAGNPKAKVELYGHINRGVMVADDGNDSEVYQVDNSASQSRFGIKSSIQATDNLEIGTLLEAGLNVNPSSKVSQDKPRDNGDATFTRRHVDLFLAHNTYGTFFMGHGATGSDDTANIDLSGTSVAGDSSVSDFAGGLHFYDKNTGSLSSASIADTFNNMNGLGRDVRLRYDTPTYAGFQASGSYIADGGGDVALKYAADFTEVKVATAVAYAKPRGASDVLDTQYNGSLSALHTSGFNASISGGRQEYKKEDSRDGSFYYVKLGYRDRFFSTGETRLSIDYGRYEDIMSNKDDAGNMFQFGDGDVFGAQVVHDFTGLGTELYAGFRHYRLDGEGRDYDNINALMTGLRVKF